MHNAAGKRTVADLHIIKIKPYSTIYFYFSIRSFSACYSSQYVLYIPGGTLASVCS